MTGTAACGKALPKEGKGEITNGVNGGGDRPKALQRYESNKNYCYEILHPLVKIIRRLVRSMCSDHGAEPAVGLRDADARRDLLRDVPHHARHDAARGDRPARSLLPQIRLRTAQGRGRRRGEPRTDRKRLQIGRLLCADLSI